MGALSLDVGRTVAAYLRQEWPRDTAKYAARAFDTTQNTTKGWLAGVRPAGAFFDMMVARWGLEFLAKVYSPFDWARQAALDVELETALASLEEIKERMRERHNGISQKSGGQVLPMADRSVAQAHEDVASADHKIDRSAS